MHQFTDSLIRKLAIPKAGNKIHYDPSTPGFGCRVTASGTRSFILNYVTRAGRERRITIGSTINWRVTDARTEARRLKQLVDQGGDPLADVAAERGAATVFDLIERFEEEHLARKRPGTAADYRLLLTKHVRPHFGAHAKVADVKFSDVDALHRKITKTGATYSANRCIAVVSKMFSLAIKWGWRSDNPAKGIERNPEAKRKRYATAAELTRLSEALNAHDDQQAANIFWLCLFTGCRVGEAMSAVWNHFDLTSGTWTKPGSTTKQKTDHAVPLSAPARQLLTNLHKRANSEWVFPADSASGHRVAVNKVWPQICKSARINGLRVHDLRHSYASQLASAGFSLPIIGALLGHSTPVTTARYAHLFDDPLRQATERVGAILTGKPPADVVPLNKRGRR
jgi:integrase